MTKKKAFGTGEGRQRFLAKFRNANRELTRAQVAIPPLLDEPPEDEFTHPAPFFHENLAPVWP